VRVLLVSDVRFYRDGLEELLPRIGAIDVIGTAATVDAALAARPAPDVVLLDAAVPDGISAVPLFQAAFPDACVVAAAVCHDERPVVRWAEAGVSGFVTRDQSLVDVARMIETVVDGEAPCDGRIGATLLRRLNVLSRANVVESEAQLTRREREVAALLGEGCSNKEIASRLSIELATAKNHVHAVLQKLAVRGRAEIPARLLRD
jgi:two-component system nitrate/nitrite response regulator NarL